MLINNKMNISNLAQHSSWHNNSSNKTLLTKINNYLECSSSINNRNSSFSNSSNNYLNKGKYLKLLLK